MDELDDDGVAQILYARMRDHGESLPEASYGLRLAEAEIERARDQLTRLNLLNPGTQTAITVTAALARTLQSSHRALDRLVEQHVRTTAPAQHYLALPERADGDARVEFFPPGRARAPERTHRRAGRAGQARAVLHLLATGAKDSAIALSLGVSTRTVTRLVSELTAALGASSRFQAGVRAARLNWLD